VAITTLAATATQAEPRDIIGVALDTTYNLAAESQPGCEITTHNMAVESQTWLRNHSKAAELQHGCKSKHVCGITTRLRIATWLSNHNMAAQSEHGCAITCAIRTWLPNHNVDVAAESQRGCGTTSWLRNHGFIGRIHSPPE
jgi:TorA maturation chaperone TorD